MHCFDRGKKAKLSNRGQESVFLGVNPQSGGYYILNRENNSITTSRNVCVYDFMNDEEDYLNYPRSSQNTETICEDPEPESHNSEQITDMPVSESQTAQRRSQRKVKRPEYLKDYHCTANVDYACLVVPETYEQAINSDQAELWKEAINAEVNMLTVNDTWEVTPLPEGRTKPKESGCIQSSKANTTMK